MTEHNFSRWRPHPWHGLEIGADAPRIVNAYIEITPFDVIKYEIDKVSGYLRVDRPQRSSSHPPALVRLHSEDLLRRAHREAGAGLRARRRRSARHLRGQRAAHRAVGSPPARARDRRHQALDRGEADDKIIGVLEGDYVWDHVKDISQLAPVLVERLEHYFGTYKMVPGEPNKMVISGKYGYEHAKAVIEAAREDYQESFGDALQERRRT